MPQKDLHHRLTGESRSLEGAMDRGGRAMSKAEREARRLEAQQRRLHSAMDQVGRGMMVAGAAIAAGLALSVKAAIDWESAWAGVLKTVDGTPEQMAALEEEIRGLTAVLPATHEEIAGVAEAAGQLGVQRENVSEFTKTMINMGEATNLAANDAATALARFMNIMSTAPGDVDKLGSAIVDLGNSSATTEAEIVEMALRIAGAGNSVGMAESEVLGFAAALSSVGVRAEAGGTAISRVFLTIDKSVRAGGESLDGFAEVAGMSAAEFQRAYEQDAAGAIDTFVQGLGRIQASGGDVTTTLESLGLGEIRVSDALRRLAGSGDLLTQSLETGADAWRENTALTEEAERRYATTASQMEIARNQLNDFAIDVGQTFLPMIGSVAEFGSLLAQMFSDLPGPLKTTAAGAAAVTAALLLLGGSLLVLIPRIAATKAALVELGVTQAVVANRISGGAAATVGAAARAGPWIAAIVAAGAALGLFAGKQKEFTGSAEGFRATLDEQTGALTDNTRALAVNNLEKDGALKAARDLGISAGLVVDAVLGEAGAFEELNRQFDEVAHGAKPATMSTDQFHRALNDLGSSVHTNRTALDDSQESWQRQAEAIAAASGATDQLDPATRQMADTFGVAADEAQGLTEGIESLEDALKAILGFMFSVEEAQDAAARALRDVTEAAAENGTALKGNSEAALDNRENVRSLIEADFDLVNAMANAGASAEDLTEETERLRQKFVDQMRQAGFSEEAIEEYAAAYDQIPNAVSTQIRTPGMTEAERRLRDLKLQIDRFPSTLPVNVVISQSGTLPGAAGRATAFQHGGEVGGRPGVDRNLIAATRGEFVVREPVAQQNIAALRALNATGRIPVGLLGGRPGDGASMASPGAFAGREVHVHLTSYSDRFSTQQVMKDLEYMGAS